MRSSNALKLNFPKQIFVTVAVVVAIGFYPLETFGTTEVIQGCIAGLIVSIVNVFVGYVAIAFSFNTTYTKFIQIVLGGVGLRLLFMSIVLLVLIGVFKIHVVSFIASLFGMYVIFLVLEVLYIHNIWQNTLSQNREHS